VTLEVLLRLVDIAQLLCVSKQRPHRLAEGDDFPVASLEDRSIVMDPPSNRRPLPRIIARGGEQMMSCLAILLGLPLVATLIVLFDDDGPWGQDRRWQYS
jgi:hypothetical protein